MKSLTINEIVANYKQKRKTVEKAIQRKYITAYTVEVSHYPFYEWRVEKEEADRYFMRPDPHEWMSFSVIIIHYIVKREWLNSLREEKDLKCMRCKWGWYAYISEFVPHLNRLGSVSSTEISEQTARGWFTVLNERGIHHRPASVILGYAQKHPETIFFLRCHGKCWESTQLLCDLLRIHIRSGERVYIEADGPNADSIVSDIKREAQDRFSVRK